MPRILNTNMGLGFQRGRRYDMDLGRLGKMKTSYSELRKTRDLNLQTELKKLKESMGTSRKFSRQYEVFMTEQELRLFSTYLLQREFGMGDIAQGVVNGARDLTGNVVEGAGKVVGSGVGKAAGFVGGGLAGTKIGATLGGIPGAIIGGLIGSFGGSATAGAVGSTLKGIGQDIHS